MDLGAPKTVKLPKPPLVKAGLVVVRFAAFPFVVVAGFVELCVELKDDWFELLPVFVGSLSERIDGRTPPSGMTQLRSSYKHKYAF